jgi:hypothetical protein
MIVALSIGVVAACWLIALVNFIEDADRWGILLFQTFMLAFVIAINI